MADLVTLAVALDRDEQRPNTERRTRNRQLGRKIGAEDRTVSALAWLEAVCQEDNSLGLIHQRVVSVMHWGNSLVAGLGLFLGWGAALGAFYYEGSGRVNAIGVLAVFVILPALLLLPLVLSALPGSWLRLFPGASAVAALARGLSPGKLAGFARRFLPRETREAWDRVAGGVSAHQTLYAGVQKWMVLRWSQLFALGFQIAGLSVAMYLVVFTDLAFGWSTTLASAEPQADAAWIHGVTSTMATPWSHLWEAADPSLRLIQESRYYRAAANSVTPEQAARLGEWWPFILMSMLLYGFAPRVITAVVAHLRLRKATQLSFNATPGLSPLVRRMHQALVQTTAREPEDSTATTPEPAPSMATGTNRCEIAINWSEVPIDDAGLKETLGATAVHPAGGALPPEDDRALVEKLGGQSSKDDVGIVVKAWEPPLMEFVDFVRSLRSAIGAGRTILVLPVLADGSQPITAGDPKQIQIWRRRLAGLGDPWLRVESIKEEATS